MGPDGVRHAHEAIMAATKAAVHMSRAGARAIHAEVVPIAKSIRPLSRRAASSSASSSSTTTSTSTSTATATTTTSTTNTGTILRKPTQPLETLASIVKLTQTDTSVKVWFVSSMVMYFLAITYLYGVVATSRKHVVWEFGITMFLPSVTYAYFATRDAMSVAPKRTGELIFIESGFNVLAVLTKTCVSYLGGVGNTTLYWLFAFFFFFQTVGFVRSEVLNKKPLSLSVLRSLSLFGGIIVQFWQFRANALSDATANVVDAEGRFIVFGRDAPKTLAVHYVFWVTGVLFIDYQTMLPHSGIQAVHLASVTVALFSGEFWHARLLTASHLFVLDAILWVRGGFTVIEAPFATMPRNVYVLYRRLIPVINLITLVGCLACLLAELACGASSFMCVVDDFATWGGVLV